MISPCPQPANSKTTDSKHADVMKVLKTVNRVISHPRWNTLEQFQEKCETVFPGKAHGAFPWELRRSKSQSNPREVSEKMVDQVTPLTSQTFILMLETSQ
ncbi:hypothetical protein HB777_29845 [Mesorhizobium loti]|nr:hypothetical protein HB777_29845 [Mesorhizobium loti]